MYKYKLIIFDVDGTLLDTSEGLVNAASEALSVMKYDQIEKIKIIECIGPPLGKEFVKKKYIKEEDYDVFNKIFRDLYKEKYLLQAKVYPGVVELLKTLYGNVILAVATNKRNDYANTLLEKMELSRYFNIIKGTDFDGKLNKSDLINKCLIESNIDPKDTVLIGDTESDHTASINTNINFIGVSYGFGYKNASLANNILDVLNMIQKS